MSITVKNITKSFGNQKILRGISFKLDKAEIVGLLGPNGAGKSTMMKILTTDYQADEGEAYVNSFDVAKEKKNVQKSIGYLPEHNLLSLDMNVNEHLAFIADVHKNDKSRIAQVIEQTGLTTEVHKKIGTLSKGYRQRVGLAAALLHDPEVLILDAPTTGVDLEQLLEIRKLIREIGKKKTMLLSTHIIKEVEAVCDRVLIINKGILVADKKLSDLRNEDEQTIEVEFDYRVEEAFLNRLPHVQHVKNTAGFLYEITFDTSKDMRPAVFDFAHDNKLKTLQLSRKNKNLERLFFERTS